LLRNSLFLTILVLFVVGNLYCFAADSEIKVIASVDKTEIALDEFINYTVTIEGISGSSKIPKVELPNIEDEFVVVASSQSNSINLRGGKAKIAYVILWTLSPKVEGKIKIKETKVVFEKKTYKTKKINVKVSPPKSPRKRLPRKRNLPKESPWSDREGISI